MFYRIKSEKIREVRGEDISVKTERTLEKGLRPSYKDKQL